MTHRGNAYTEDERREYDRTSGYDGPLFERSRCGGPLIDEPEDDCEQYTEPCGPERERLTWWNHLAGWSAVTVWAGLVVIVDKLPIHERYRGIVVGPGVWRTTEWTRSKAWCQREAMRLAEEMGQ